MLVTSLPLELFLCICNCLCITGIARCFASCKAFRQMILDDMEQIWNKALLVPGGHWYQMKDVAKAAKYIAWSERVPAPLPVLDTMDNIAFWGTIVKGERLLATFGPEVCDWRVNFEGNDDGDLPMRWDNANWGSRQLNFDWIDINAKPRPHPYGSVSPREDILGMADFTINLCAAVKLMDKVEQYSVLTSGCYWDMPGVFQLVDESLHHEIWLVGGDGLDVGNSGGIMLQFFDRDVYNHTITHEWVRRWCLGDKNQRSKMESATFIDEELKVGRGWNATRRDMIDTTLKLINDRLKEDVD